MEVELEDCPWCGDKGELFVEPVATTGVSYDSERCWWVVKCRSCGCRGPLGRPFGDPAIELWNSYGKTKNVTNQTNKINLEDPQQKDLSY